jgi:hypothetical protein
LSPAISITNFKAGFHNVSLHHIKLKSNFVTRQVVVGVGPTLPVEDIALLFVMDMAGDKVIMAPIISEDPSYEGNELKLWFWTVLRWDI